MWQSQYWGDRVESVLNLNGFVLKQEIRSPNKSHDWTWCYPYQNGHTGCAIPLKETHPKSQIRYGVLLRVYYALPFRGIFCIFGIFRGNLTFRNLRIPLISCNNQLKSLGIDHCSGFSAPKNYAIRGDPLDSCRTIESSSRSRSHSKPAMLGMCNTLGGLRTVADPRFA